MTLCANVPSIHIFAVILGSLEIVLFGGVIFGWHSVVYIYKDVGYFIDDCLTGTELTSHDENTWKENRSELTNEMYRVNSNNSVILAFESTTHFNNFTSSAQNPVILPGKNSYQNGISFDNLTCDEKMKLHIENGSNKQICKSQDEQFNLVFSLATSINGILSFPSGILYDRLGTRISRIISIVSFTGGQLCLIFASGSCPYLLYPGFLGLVYGGYQILLTNLQLSSLIPGLRSTIISLYSGSYDTSSAVFLLFKIVYERGISINASFAFQACLYLMVFASSTFFLFPKQHVPSPIPPTYHLQSYCCKQILKNKRSDMSNEAVVSLQWRLDSIGSIILENHSLQLNGAPSASDDTRDTHRSTPDEDGMQEAETMLKTDVVVEEPKTFRQVVLSTLFLTDLVWMCTQRLRSWIFVGMFNSWITRLACGDKMAVSHYTSVYAAMQFFGIFTAPLSGRLMDRQIKGEEKYKNSRYGRLHASIASFVLNSTVSVLLTIGTLIPVLSLQYVTCMLHTLHRSFLYGPNSAFVANAFPNEHFGKLFGVTLTVSALFSTIQYPLFLIMQGPLNGDPFAINIFLLVLMLVSYIHPIYIWRYLKKNATSRHL